MLDLISRAFITKLTNASRTNASRKVAHWILDGKYVRESYLEEHVLSEISSSVWMQVQLDINWYWGNLEILEVKPHCWIPCFIFKCYSVNRKFCSKYISLLSKGRYLLANQTYMSLLLPSSSNFFLGKITIECCLNKQITNPTSLFRWNFFKREIPFPHSCQKPKFSRYKRCVQFLFQGLGLVSRALLLLEMSESGWGGFVPPHISVDWTATSPTTSSWSCLLRAKPICTQKQTPRFLKTSL